MDRDIRFGIITPTYRREAMLRSFIPRVRSQSYQSWHLTIVHDGESELSSSLVRGFSERDSRINYLETPSRANDCGVTPRLVGISRVAASSLADYLVLWDDDNLFFSRALKDVARSLAAADYPDLLLVPLHHYGGVIPPTDTDISFLGIGMIDMANLVIRSDLVLRHYPAVAEQCRSEGNFYYQDFFLFEAIRRAIPREKIRVARCKPIALYDGLRLEGRLRLLRQSLGFPEFNLARFSWYRRLLRLLDPHGALKKLP